MLILGERLRNLRLKCELKQDDLLRKFSISKSTYSMYESGQRRPSYELLIKFATFYNVSIDYLLGRIPTYYPEPQINTNTSLNTINMINLILKTKEKLYPKIMEYIKFLNFEEKQSSTTVAEEQEEKNILGVI